jgi:hypothetical protein
MSKKKLISTKNLSTLDFYPDGVVVEENYKDGWSSWSKNCQPKLKKTLETIMYDVKSDLKNIKVELFIVPQNKTSKNDSFWADYPWDYVSEKTNNADNIQFLILSLYLYKNKLYEEEYEDGIYLQHSTNKESSKKVAKILVEYFGDKMEWDKSDDKAICIHL